MAESEIIFVVGTKCDPSVEEEFNRWYNQTHIPEVSKSPGVRRGTRYQAVKEVEGHPKYLAIYEMDGEEGLAKFNEFSRRRGKGEVPPFTKGPPFEVVWRIVYRKIGPGKV